LANDRIAEVRGVQRPVRVDQAVVGKLALPLGIRLAGVGRQSPALCAQGLDRRDEAVFAFLGGRDGFRIETEEHPEQPAPQAGDGRAIAIVQGGDAEITLCVQPHGAIAQIGRSDTQEDVVDDHELRMDHQAALRKPRNRRVVDT
jgi:hypothetical protein